jgi:PIN domain nuclease of toxin-antitoxin system
VTILIDTHILLWYAKGDPRLSSSIRANLEHPQTTCYVSKASLWEITIKVALGKLDLIGSFDDFIDELPWQGFHLLDINVDDLRTLYTLPFRHGDPFGRLIIAQALSRRWPVVSDDAKFRQYSSQLITER